MDGGVGHLVDQVIGSPWLYVALVVLATVDGFLPLIPSETAVITAGVFAATGKPNVFLVIAAATLGAFAGDHVSYVLGRFVAGRWRRRRAAGPAPAPDLVGGPLRRRRAALGWARQALTRRGGLILIAARYLPGGRTAVTLATGAVGYPLRLFSSFDAVGAVSWGIYCTMIGFLGGTAFQDNPLAGLLLGLGVAVAISVLAEVVRRYRRRRAGAGRAGGSTGPAAPADRPAVAVRDSEP